MFQPLVPSMNKTKNDIFVYQRVTLHTFQNQLFFTCKEITLLPYIIWKYVGNISTTLDVHKIIIVGIQTLIT